MNHWQVPGDIFPGLRRIPERVHDRDIWSYHPLFQQSRDSVDATGATYSPAGALSSLTNGTNLASRFHYNNRLQPCRIFVTTGTTNPTNCADLGTVDGRGGCEG